MNRSVLELHSSCLASPSARTTTIDLSKGC